MRDIFAVYNQKNASEVVKECKECDKILIIGPPRSGKSFFIDNYLRDKLQNVKIDEFTPGIEKRTVEEVKENKVIEFFKKVLPFINSIKEQTKVEDKELSKLLGDNAPKYIYEEAKRRIGNSRHFTYLISLKEIKECINKGGCDNYVSDALSIIEKSLGSRKIKWLHGEYIPPGLVNEVIDLINASGQDEASKKVSEWINAYFDSLKILGINEEIEWESSISTFVSTLIKEVVRGFLSAILLISTGPPITAAGAGLVAVITNKLLKEEKENAVNEMIKLQGELIKLCKNKCREFNELGKLLVYKLSFTTGADPEEAEDALKHIAGITEEQLKSEVEVLEDKIKLVESELKKLDNEIDSLNEKISAGVKAGKGEEFAKGLIYSNVRVENYELKIRIEGKYYKFVRAGNFNKSINDVIDGLKNNDIMVLIGPKGIGKSTLTAAVIWELFGNSDIGLVARISSFGDEEKFSSFETFVENYNNQFRQYFHRLLILYDPLSTEAYETETGKVQLKSSIMNDINSLLEIMKYQAGYKPFALIVLPSDIYDGLGNEVKAKLDKYKFDVSFNNIEFLAEIIKEYASGCNLGSEILDELAKKVSAYNSGYTLIARLVGEELARNNCNAGEVKELIEKGERNAEKFIANYINTFFDVVRESNRVGIDKLKLLSEIFALRRRYINHANPGHPILTQGIIRTIESKSNSSEGMSEEEVEWLVYRKHDLMENTISKLLDGEDLGEASKPWTNYDLKELIKKAEKNSVEYFVEKYGNNFIDRLREYSNECWKRAALIIGYGIALSVGIPKADDLPKHVSESLKDSLNKCGVDEYLLADNIIPEFVLYLILYSVNEVGRSFNILDAFVDKFRDALGEINRIYSIAENKNITDYEEFYGLGLVSIITNAGRSSKDISPEDANRMLKIASFLVGKVWFPGSIRLILHVLEPLRDKAPYKYPMVLDAATNIQNLDYDTVIYIFKQLNEWKKLDDFMKYKSSVVNTLSAYANLRVAYPQYLSKYDKDIFHNIKVLLNMLGNIPLGKFAQAYVLALKLEAMPKEEIAGIDVVNRANGLLNELDELDRNAKSLLNDSEFMDYVESIAFRVDEEIVKKIIKDESLNLKNALASYKFNNNELDGTEKLFEEVAKKNKEISNYLKYLKSSNQALKVKFIEGSLVGNNLVKEYKILFKEALDNLRVTAVYLNSTSHILADYLVSLALTNNIERVTDLLEKYRDVLYFDKKFFVVTRLMLNVFLGSNKVRFEVGSEELIKAFQADMCTEFLPALKVAFGLLKSEEAIDVCKKRLSGNEENGCKDAIDAVIGDKDATNYLRIGLKNALLINFWKDVMSRLKSLNISNCELNNIFYHKYLDLVDKLDGRSLIQIFPPSIPNGYFALMLNALVNKDFDLARVILLQMTFYHSSKLGAKLFLEAYRNCCDLNTENFKLALAKLFFFHF